MSNIVVTIWNSAIDSRLNFGWPNPDPAVFCVICWPVRVHVVGRDALHHLRQLHPVASLERQLFHLAAVHVARDLGRRGVDERRFGGDGQRLVHLRDLQRDRHVCILADEQFHPRHEHRPEPRQLCEELIGAGRKPEPVLTGRVGDGNRLHTGREPGGGDRRAGQD
jgi:hypothetical protein